jgi:hypothetical protein
MAGTLPRRRVDTVALIGLGIMVLVALWLVFGNAVSSLPDPQAIGSLNIG